MFCLKREASVKSKRKLADKSEVFFVLSLLNHIPLIFKRSMNRRKRNLGLDQLGATVCGYIPSRFLLCSSTDSSVSSLYCI